MESVVALVVAESMSSESDIFGFDFVIYQVYFVSSVRYFWVMECGLQGMSQHSTPGREAAA